MGQRTQLIVRYKNIDGVGKQKTVIYHNQWGIGKMILLDIMNVLNFYQSSYKFEVPKKLHKGFDATKYHKDLKLEKNPLQTIDDIKSVFDNLDNNNGGAYLELELDKYNKIEKGKLFFLGGYEDFGNKAFTKKLTLKGWFNIQINSTFIVKSFTDSFKSLLKFYNVEISTR